MKKTMMTMMAAAMMLMTSAPAMAATPDFCRDNAPCVEADYTCCGGGYYGGGRGRGGRGGYGCGGGYCWSDEGTNEG